MNYNRTFTNQREGRYSCPRTSEHVVAAIFLVPIRCPASFQIRDKTIGSPERTDLFKSLWYLEAELQF